MSLGIDPDPIGQGLPSSDPDPNQYVSLGIDPDPSPISQGQGLPTSDPAPDPNQYVSLGIDLEPSPIGQGQDLCRGLKNVDLDPSLNPMNIDIDPEQRMRLDPVPNIQLIYPTTCKAYIYRKPPLFDREK